MRTVPIDVLATWPSPNYTNPVTRGPSAVILIIILSSFVVVAVSLRVYTRLCVQRWSGFDDLFMVLAVICTIGLNSSIILAISQFGWARHVYDIPPHLLAASGLIVFVAKLLFFVATSFLRLSLLSFYYRLVHESGKNQFRKALHFSVIFVVSLLLCSVFISIFVCVPVSDYWRYPPRANRKCFNEGPVGFVVAIINCVADLLITCLPIPLVLRLNMPLRNRLGVLALFCLGFIVLVASILRTYYWYVTQIVSYDVTWEAYPLWIASAIEVNVGVICACAPAIRVLIKRKCLPALTDLGRSRTTQSETRSDTAATEYSNPRNSRSLGCLSPTFQKAHVARDSQQVTTPITPTTPNSPRWSLFSKAQNDRNPLQFTPPFAPSTPLSPSWPLREQERESSVIHLDVYDAPARQKLDIREPVLKKDSIPRMRLPPETAPGSESGSVSSLLVPGQEMYAWNDGASR